MKKSCFSESQIISILKHAETGAPVPELCREHGISSNYDSMGNIRNFEKILTILALTLAAYATTTQHLPTSPPALLPSLTEEPPAFRLLRLPKSMPITPISAGSGASKRLDSKRFTSSCNKFTDETKRLECFG
ncbi:MAG: Transposase [Glomeribacter sp. 1016415]|nr:Transposase [Glomeribacter sp. 1016415]